MEFLPSPPAALSSYVPLAEHQAQTPASFFTGPPVLYHHCKSATFVIHQSEIAESEAVKRFVETAGEARGDEVNGATNGEQPNGKQPDGEQPNGEQPNGEHEQQGLVNVRGVKVFVTSESLVISSSAIGQRCTLKIPYPSISLHATRRPQTSDGQASLYLQVVTEAGAPDDEERQCMQMSIIPSRIIDGPDTTATQSAQQSGSAIANGDAIPPASSLSEVDSTTVPIEPDCPPPTPTMAMFTALSACANLHPDPIDDMMDDDTGPRPLIGGDGVSPFHILSSDNGNDGSTSGLPPAFPGSGGWITSENLHEHFDNEGNWLPGRGPQEQTQDVEDSQGEPNGYHGQDNKQENLGPGAGNVRMREDGDAEGNGAMNGDTDDETKWRRTG